MAIHFFAKSAVQVDIERKGSTWPENVSETNLSIHLESVEDHYDEL